VTPEEENENYDVIVVDMDPLVDELVEIRALLERINYHMELRRGTGVRKWTTETETPETTNRVIYE